MLALIANFMNFNKLCLIFNYHYYYALSSLLCNKTDIIQFNLYHNALTISIMVYIFDYHYYEGIKCMSDIKSTTSNIQTH